MRIYLVYNGDGWLSTSSLNLVAVCESKEKAEELMFDDLVENYDVVSQENLSEDEFDEDSIYLEDCINEYHSTGQILGCGFGYAIRPIDTDEIL